MSIFNVNFGNLMQNLIPPILRQPVQIAWLTALTQPLQYNNILFNDYLSGSTYQLFNSGTTYHTNDRVVYIDRGVYENISGSTGIVPINNNYWNQININYIGAQERSKYAAIKLNYEYALNRWFETSGFTSTSPALSAITPSLFTASANTIYIQTNVTNSNGFLMGNLGTDSSFMDKRGLFTGNFMVNSYNPPADLDYTIFVPNYIYSAISESQVRSFSDKINISGMRYSVSGY